MDKDFKPVKSIYNSNYETIKNIMFLYEIEQFDLDCTYSKGAFWKDLPSPINKSDLLHDLINGVPVILFSNSLNTFFACP